MVKEYLCLSPACPFSVLNGETASSDKKEAEKFKKEFSDLTKAESFVPQPVLN